VCETAYSNGPRCEKSRPKSPRYEKYPVRTKEIDLNDKEAVSELFDIDSGDSVPFDTNAVYQRLIKLNPKKSAGPDGLHPKLLKECAGGISRPLSLLFQASYNVGVPPTEWKSAEVSPIFKKGQKSSRGSYRPVSLTSVPCKIMESIIRD